MSPWFKCDTEIVTKAAELGPLTVLVYLVLCKHADNSTMKAWPSIPTIARLCGSAERSVRRSISRLQTAGLIRVETMRAESGSRLPNRYQIIPQEHPDTRAPTPGHQSTQDPGLNVRAPLTPEHPELDLQELDIDRSGATDRQLDDETEKASQVDWLAAKSEASELCRSLGLRCQGSRDRSLALQAVALVQRGILPQAWLNGAVDGFKTNRGKSKDNPWAYFRTALVNGAQRLGRDLHGDLARVVPPAELLEVTFMKKPPARLLDHPDPSLEESRREFKILKEEARKMPRHRYGTANSEVSQ